MFLFVDKDLKDSRVKNQIVVNVYCFLTDNLFLKQNISLTIFKSKITFSAELFCKVVFKFKNICEKHTKRTETLRNVFVFQAK